MPRSARHALMFLGLLLVGPLCWWGVHLALGRSASGLRLDGETLEPSPDPGAEVARRARVYLHRPVRLRVGAETHERRRSELGVELDVEAATRRVEGAGRSGNPVLDLQALVAAGMGTTDVGWRLDLDGERVREVVREFARAIDRPPHPARFNARGALVELSADGLELDRAAAVRELAAALRGGRRTVTLPVVTLSSGVGDDALPTEFAEPPPPVLIARYSTDYEVREAGRTHNVRTAAEYLDGAVIEPFSRLSFNTRVGARSRERGYRLAHVIIDGEMVDGLGGGVCQVASTLHAAAFLGGLRIPRHTPHSRPSAYIPMGLDATVVWPTVDLGIENPFPFPITVRSRAESGHMVVELYGASRPLSVTWRRRTLATESWGDRYVEDETVRLGHQRVSQRGIRGFTVLRERTMTGGALGIRHEESQIRYPPTDRVVRVAVGSLDPFSGEPVPDGVPANPF